MPKIKKRSDGRYQKNIRIGFRENGKPKYKTIYANTQAELQRKIDEYNGLVRQGITSGEKTTLAEWAPVWLETYKKQYEFNTYMMYKSCVHTHILTAPFAFSRLNNITLAEVQLYLNTKLNTPREAQVILMTFRQIFDHAIKNKLMVYNPAADVELPPYKAPKKRTLTDEEINALAAADLTLKERLFVDLGRYAGLRRGEILALTRRDIDFKNNLIKINKSLIITNKGDSFIKESPKTDAGFRSVPLLAPVRNDLANHKYDIYLFLSAHDKIFNKSAYRRFWQSILKKLNIPDCDLTAHILRHTYATSLYYSGVDIKTAQFYLGHKDIKTTLEVYTHIHLDNIISTEKLENYIAVQN